MVCHLYVPKAVELPRIRCHTASSHSSGLAEPARGASFPGLALGRPGAEPAVLLPLRDACGLVACMPRATKQATPAMAVGSRLSSCLTSSVEKGF